MSRNASSTPSDQWIAERQSRGQNSVVTFDPEKNEVNIAVRGLAFNRVEDFDWSSATLEYDRRHDYGEARFVATGLIDGRLHVLVFTPRDNDIRVISLRRANKREQATYASQT